MKVANLTEANNLTKFFTEILEIWVKKMISAFFYKRFFKAILLNLYYSSDCIIRQNLNTIAN